MMPQTNVTSREVELRVDAGGGCWSNHTYLQRCARLNARLQVDEHSLHLWVIDMHVASHKHHFAELVAGWRRTSKQPAGATGTKSKPSLWACLFSHYLRMLGVGLVSHATLLPWLPCRPLAKALEGPASPGPRAGDTGDPWVSGSFRSLAGLKGGLAGALSMVWRRETAAGTIAGMPIASIGTEAGAGAGAGAGPGTGVGAGARAVPRANPPKSSSRRASRGPRACAPLPGRSCCCRCGCSLLAAEGTLSPTKPAMPGASWVAVSIVARLAERALAIPTAPLLRLPSSSDTAHVLTELWVGGLPAGPCTFVRGCGYVNEQ